MKKLLAISLIVVTIWSMSSCGLSEPAATTQKPTSATAITEETIDYVVQHAESLISQGDYMLAYQYLEDIAFMNPVYNDLLQKTITLFVEETLNTATRYASSENYEQAVYVLKEANNVYSCEEFSDRIEEYEVKIPRKLQECHIIDEDDYAYLSTAEDCFGNVYKDAFGFERKILSEEGGYAVFYLNGKYKNLSGIFVGSSELFEDMTVDCRIYADGKQIFESPELGRTSLPVSIDLDVSGVIQLRVEYMYYTWSTEDPCCIFDLTLS